jgi:hypothetical protein
MVLENNYRMCQITISVNLIPCNSISITSANDAFDFRNMSVPNVDVRHFNQVASKRHLDLDAEVRKFVTTK